MTKKPHEESGTSDTSSGTMRHRKEGTLGGVVLIVLGVLFLAHNFLPRFNFSDYWPLILVAIGVTLLVRSRRS